MRVVLSAALLLACYAWTIYGEVQSGHVNSNQGEGVTNNQGSVNRSETVPVKQQQPEQRTGVWDEPLRFNTKAKDSCTMVVSSQGEHAKLRVSCKTKGKSYWCDFLGKPNLCRAYSNNPRHYFTQIMWEMRKLTNACQGPRSYKPQMCRGASDESQMVFHNSWPKISTSRPTAAAPKQQLPKASVSSRQPVKPVKQAKPAASKPVQPRKPVKSTTPRPTEEPDNQASVLAEQYCWRSLQGICSYFISWFN